MVFFTCNTCGSSVKKAQVEKHYTIQCRDCTVLSCVDCGKDFYGDEYKSHVKCISEEEKYSGVDYKPKPGANKGEKKQEEWIQKIQTAVEKLDRNSDLWRPLNNLLNYTNIPRKEKKFHVFLKNSLGIYNDKLISKVWAVVSEAQNDKDKENEDSVTKTNENGDDDGDNSTNNSEVSKKKKNKKEKHKTEVENSPTKNVENVDSDVVKSKKKRKQKNEEMESDDKKSENEDGAVDEPKKKKQKSKKNEERLTDEVEIKKESKKKRSKKSADEESMDPNNSSANLEKEESGEVEQEIEQSEKSKRKKKRKNGESELQQENPTEELKKKKKHNAEEETNESPKKSHKESKNSDETIEENGEEVSKKSKFKIKKIVISKLTEQPNHEMKKKLLKKEVTQIYRNWCSEKTRNADNEELNALFTKLLESGKFESKNGVVKLVE